MLNLNLCFMVYWLRKIITGTTFFFSLLLFLLFKLPKYEKKKKPRQLHEKLRLMIFKLEHCSSKNSKKKLKQVFFANGGEGLKVSDVLCFWRNFEGWFRG